MKTCQKIFTLLVWAVAAGVLGTAAACNPPVINPTGAQSTFELVMLNHEVAERRYWGSTIEGSWPVLQAAYPDEIRCRIVADDIESYAWGPQVITLTAAASQSFRNGEQDCLESEVSGALVMHHRTPFVVLYDNLPIYGGLLIPSQTMTAEAFYYPIILFEWVEGKLVLRVQPGFTWDNQFTEDEWQLIKDERIRELFLESGTLE